MAVVTALPCGFFLILLMVSFFRSLFDMSGMLGRTILFLGLAGFLPTYFIWSSVRAWRFLPKGIEALSVLWALAGLGVVFFGVMLGYMDGWKIRSITKVVGGLSIFLLGVWLTRQQKRLYDVA